MNSEKKLILIAEDSPTQAMQLKLVLESNSFSVVHAADGKLACELLGKHQPDLIISDVMMPVMNGFEFSKYIKGNEKYKNIPVLLLTSLTDKTDVLKGLASGANTFITKPFETDYLLKVINNLLNGEIFDQEVQSILDQDTILPQNKSVISFLISAYQTAILKNQALEKSQEELKKTNLGLEETVKERTKELDEAKKRAEKSDMLKSIFLSNVSHDLRTPMNAIIGFSELLKDGDLSDISREDYLDLISKNGENLLNLINDIIDISKIEAGIIQCNKLSNCPLNDLLKELEQSFQQYKFLKDSDNVKLFFNKDNIIPDFAIKTDAFRLKQILSNLISNAVKFTKEGEIEFSYQLIDEELIRFYVKDTGIGIPTDKIDDLFKRYEQVKCTDSPEVGTGLGLAIAENLTKLLGGKMWIESEEGKGSTFYFTINFKEASGPVMDYFPKPEKDPNNYDLHKKVFLIVEDDMSNFNYLKAVLTKANAKVLWAKDGERAVEICKANTDISMVLMDIHLPKLNGFIATKKIHEINSEIPVIAQTAYAMSGDEEKCYDAGCVDYMAKPIKPNILLSKIEKNLKT